MNIYQRANLSARQYSRHAGAFTLLELLAAVVVMSIISAVLVPVITAASDSYATTREVRSTTERVAFALDRITRVIREAPIGPSDTGIGVTSASASGIELSDGTGFTLVGSRIELLVPGQSNAPLATEIDAMTISYFGDDGIANTISNPSESRRIAVQIQSGDVIMSVVIFPRIWIGQGGA